ncbi:MAG: hypothetical protein PWP56_376 [Acetobacterium sp.]|jgi:hypothetical protein|nr:hypothetical protein [Acetobacterium sp.]
MKPGNQRKHGANTGSLFCHDGILMQNINLVTDEVFFVLKSRGYWGLMGK